jgi:hypothetical protein
MVTFWKELFSIDGSMKELIVQKLPYHHYLQIKSFIQKCENDKTPKKVKPGYCPAYKWMIAHPSQYVRP